MKEIGGGGVAVALALLGFVLIIMAVHGSYYAVWRVFSADAGTFALYKGAAAAGSPQASSTSTSAGIKPL